MLKRSYLKDKVVLIGDSDGKSFQRSFTITRKISEGADGVTYEAFHKRSGKGVLKEFYPDDSLLLLERDSCGRLGHNNEIRVSFEQFRKYKEEFLKPYELLLDIRRKNDDKDLASFIPFFELYHGVASSESYESTVYIWTPEPELETFDKICDEIHKHPNNRPEHKLVTALKAIETLTKCICALHSAGIIHRDIKPSNFGFRRRRGETLTQAIMLFDIDSLCSIWTNNYEYKCTAGYAEPEAAYEDCTNQTDIYSIGATLFSAIIVTEETRHNGYLFDTSFYDQIGNLVAESELIKASEANSHPRLRRIISEMLNKSLCKRQLRYGCCEELLEDIQEALFYALPTEVTRNNKAGEKWVLSNADKVLDSNSEKNSYLAIQYHLYKYPMYKSLESNQKILRICLIGFDTYAQKFLDACLQTGQMRNVSMEIIIVGADSEDKSLYLAERPALNEFFNIDGQLDGEDSYGKIIFCGNDMSIDSRRPGIESILECVGSVWGNEDPNYVFVSLGKDLESSRIASLINKRQKKRGKACLVNYICEKDEYIGNSEIIPVKVNQRVRINKHYKEIERMAFNTHLVWEKSLNIDYSIIKKEFKKRYNHDSCVSSVISLKYKLYELGIDLDRVTAAEAALSFQTIINSNDNQLKNELMWIEHRRWVTEKILLGWKGMSNLDKCLSGNTKNNRTKEHVCIAKSRPDQLLTDITADTNGSNIWNSLSDIELEKLDDLDRISVELHRLYEIRANEIRNSEPINNSLIAGIREASDEAGVIGIFNEWYDCVKGMWKGNTVSARLYKGLEHELVNALRKNASDKLTLFMQQINSFSDSISPLIASMIPHNWKQEDAAFIDSIPFILTYSEKIWLNIPFNAGVKASERFLNISSSLIVNPEKIIFFYTAEQDKDVHYLEKAFNAVARLMDSKRLRSVVEFVLFYNDSIDVDIVGTKLKECGGKRVKNISFIHIDNVTEWINKYISDSEKRNVIAPSVFEKNASIQSKKLELLGVYDLLPWYVNEFGDIKTNEAIECKALDYINKRTPLTVNEMLQLSEGVNISEYATDYFDEFEKLLGIYHDMPEEWKALCSNLKLYLQDHCLLASFNRADSRLGKKKYRYIVPSSSLQGAKKIVNDLKKSEIIDAHSCITRYASDAYAVILYAANGQGYVFEELLSNVYALGLCDSLITRTSADCSSIDILFDDLLVRNIQLNCDETKVKTLLKHLNDIGLIIALREEECGISFTFASRQIKSLLSNKDSIHEMRVYYSLKNSGEYDDVVQGTLSLNRFPEVKQRCCIATKGFNSLIVLFDDAVNEEHNGTVQLEARVKELFINASTYNVSEYCIGSCQHSQLNSKKI